MILYLHYSRVFLDDLMLTNPGRRLEYVLFSYSTFLRYVLPQSASPFPFRKDASAEDKEIPFLKMLHKFGLFISIVCLQ